MAGATLSLAPFSLAVRIFFLWGRSTPMTNFSQPRARRIYWVQCTWSVYILRNGHLRVCVIHLPYIPVLRYLMSHLRFAYDFSWYFGSKVHMMNIHTDLWNTWSNMGVLSGHNNIAPPDIIRTMQMSRSKLRKGESSAGAPFCFRGCFLAVTHRSDLVSVKWTWTQAWRTRICRCRQVTGRDLCAISKQQTVRSLHSLQLHCEADGRLWNHMSCFVGMGWIPRFVNARNFSAC